MNKITTEKWNMAQTVLNTLNSQPALIASSPALGAAVGQLQIKINGLQNILEDYTKNNRWRTVEKHQLAVAAIEETTALAKVIRAYAKSVDDTNLYNRMAFNKISLRKGGINNLLLKMKVVLDEAAPLVPVLIDFAYNDDKFTAFSTLYHDLEARKVAPRNAIVDHKSLGRQANEEIKAICAILEVQIDAILLVLKPDNEVFYAAYKHARKIIRYGHRGDPAEAPLEPDDGI